MKSRETLADWDMINPPLRLRGRKPGDRFHPLGMKGSKKLKDFFIELKTDEDKRETIPLVVDKNEYLHPPPLKALFWVPPA